MLGLRLLHPSFSWHTTPSVEAQDAILTKSSDPPRVRWLWPRWIRVCVGYVHNWLVPFSTWYTARYGTRSTYQIWQLPFGLVLKRSDGTRLEEVAAMRMARDAGLPVPIVVSYGEHPDAPHAPLSILMTRMPGEEMFEEIWEWYNEDERGNFCHQLRQYLETIRQWKAPEIRMGDESTPPARIFSALGTDIRSVRVPRHKIGPCSSEEEFHGILECPSFLVKESKNYDELVTDVETFEKLPKHDFKFSHGDLMFHNLLVLPDGRISGFLDWEAAGWYPSYWEYTTSWALFKPGQWWYEVVLRIGGAAFEAERPGDLARRMMGTDSGTFSW